MSRRRVTTYVEIELDEIGDDDLIAECKERGFLVGNPETGAEAAPLPRLEWEALLADIRTAAQRGDHQHLDVLLHRLDGMCGPPQPTVRVAAGEQAIGRAH